jgi:prepilin-type N-terminal cleavage/methylation domain-containing protein
VNGAGRLPGLRRQVPGRARPRGGPPGAEAGFSLIELMVALLILALVMAGLAYAGTISMVDVAFASQRQAATGLANQAMEQVRALPFATVAAGLSTADPSLSSDPSITTQGSGSSTTYWFQGEQIPTSSSSTSVVPLNPHVQGGIVVGTNTYSVSTYVTYAQPPNTTSAPSSIPVFRVTVIASWVNSERHGVLTQVQDQSLVYAPNGCQSSATHPYTAPCQPFFYTTAADLGATISLAGPSGASPVPAIADLGTATLFPTSNASELQLEQVQTARGAAQTTGGTITYTDGTAPLQTGSQAAPTAASNDATSSLGPYQSASASQSGSPVTASSPTSPATLSVSPGTQDAATSTATVSAGQPVANQCTNISGQLLTSGQACSFSSADQAGAQPAALVLGWGTTGPSGVGSATLASLAPPPAASVAAAERDPQAGSASCTQVPAGTDGCIHGGAQRFLGTLELAELPPGIAPLPAGWNPSKGIVELAGFADSVTAEAGVGAGAPSASVVSGTIAYWNGSGYSSLPASSPPGTAIPAAPVTVDDPTYPTGDVQVSIVPNLSVGGTSVNDPAAGCSSPCTRTQASAVSASPVLGTISYQVTYQGSVIFDATIAVNLGTLSVSSTYQQAPSSAP